MATTEPISSANQAFNTAEMSNALADMTGAHENKNNAVVANGEEARKHGWAEPVKYNYQAYNASSREEREAVEAEHDLSDWAANAAKYEWSDEYGDVGPAHPELERLLFHDGTGTHTGILFHK